ncbi:MAG: glycerol-3-phosphate acyltransferase [Ilumatobacteraceae bacterium]
MPTSIAILVVMSTGLELGSIPFANVVARRHGISDLRVVGDRNPGFWNAFELLGRRRALPIFVGDVAKGAAAAGLGVMLAADGQWWMADLGAGAAMVGHAFPIFAGFRGGRSVLTFVGGACVFAPLAAGIAIGITVAVWSVTRRFDRAARFGVATFPLIELATDGPARTAATGLLMTFIGLRFADATQRTRRANRTNGRARSGGGVPGP